jgi:putative ABC transport system permease protein
MFGYYLQLAMRSFRRTKALTALMVLAIALGIGASMTTLTVFYVLSGDPIPAKSGKLFYPRIEPRSLGKHAKPEPEPMEQMTRFDAEELLRQKRGDHQALMTAGGARILPQGASPNPSARPRVSPAPTSSRCSSHRWWRGAAGPPPRTMRMRAWR